MTMLVGRAEYGRADQSARRINKIMRISEIITPADKAKIKGLDRNAKLSAFALKRERYQQKLKRYSDRMRNRKQGSAIPKRPEPPKPPQL